MGEVFFGDTGPMRTLDVAHEPTERALKDLQLDPISDSEWRVSDNRLADDHPAKLLGFIEQRTTGLSVMPLENARPGPWKKCGSMEQALELFVIAPCTIADDVPPGDTSSGPKHAAPL